MAVFTYTAKRSVVAGHTVGAEYSLEISIQPSPRAREIVKTEQRSRGGATETIYHRADVTRQITLRPIRASELAAVHEFLDSVEGGESFGFDMYGTIAAPHNLVTCIRIDEALEDTIRAVGGALDASAIYTITFKIREV
jgi:hypothetical protein